MFDLGKSIADWLGDLKQTGTFEDADLEELESHVKDEIEQLVDRGLTQKEAFWIATSRAGNREELPEEYAKTNSRTVWRHRFLWMVVGVFAYLVLNYLIGLLSDATALIAASSGIEGYSAVIVNVSVRILLTWGALVSVYLVLSRDRFEVSSRYWRVSKSRSRTIVFYAIPVALLGLLTYLSAWSMPLLLSQHLTPEGLGQVNYGTHFGSAIFSIVLAVSLAWIALVLSRPKKRKSQVGAFSD